MLVAEMSIAIATVDIECMIIAGEYKRKE